MTISPATAASSNPPARQPPSDLVLACEDSAAFRNPSTTRRPNRYGAFIEIDAFGTPTPAIHHDPSTFTAQLVSALSHQKRLILAYEAPLVQIPPALHPGERAIEAGLSRAWCGHAGPYALTQGLSHAYYALCTFVASQSRLIVTVDPTCFWTQDPPPHVLLVEGFVSGAGKAFPLPPNYIDLTGTTPHTDDAARVVARMTTMIAATGTLTSNPRPPGQPAAGMNLLAAAAQAAMATIDPGEIRHPGVVIFP